MNLPVRALLMLAAVFLAACPPPGGDGESDAGGPPPDFCNSLEEALTSAECQLTLGEAKTAYLNPPSADAPAQGDQDWYSFIVPANANTRTLIHLRGGYAVPNTAVNLSLNLLEENGQTSLAKKSDRHGQGAPKPVDIVLPFSTPNARLVVLVKDDPVNPTRPAYDLRSPYTLMAEVLEDPDANEPNDTTPTQIATAPVNGIPTGTQTGFLATEGDVDLFSVDVQAGKILYVSVKAPQVANPPEFRLRYELRDPAGTPIAEGVAQNAFIDVDLATARLVKTAGTHTIHVSGYLGAGVTAPAPGSVDLQYTVEVRIVDEADPSDTSSRNDTIETATTIGLTATGQTQTRTGRIGSEADPDWFRVDLSASNVPTVLRYRLTQGDTGGRFPPLPGAVDRELRVLQQVTTGATTQDKIQACMTDKVVCPRSFDGDGVTAGLFSEQCQNFDPPRCLWGRRVEHPRFENLRNFEGTLPVPPHSSTVSLFFLVQDERNDWADDLDYTLTVQWVEDADEQARFAGGTVEQTPSSTLTRDSSGSYPVPPSGTTELSGTLSYGPGFWRRHDPNNGQGVRGPTDYDAVVSDQDRFHVQLPASIADADAGTYDDRAWELQWELQHLPDGGLPSDVVIELEFCDGDRLDGGVCTPVRRSSTGSGLTLGYSSAAVDGWHNVNAPAEDRQSVWDREVTTGSTVVTAREYGCFCLEPRFIRGGHMSLNVLSVDRNNWAPQPYRIRTAWTDYPQQYAANDGGVRTCPAPLPDGGAGCFFTR